VSNEIIVTRHGPSTVTTPKDADIGAVYEIVNPRPR
jgi:hypothetical protein